jgi:hypothetical protein
MRIATVKTSLHADFFALLCDGQPSRVVKVGKGQEDKPADRQPSRRNSDAPQGRSEWAGKVRTRQVLPTAYYWSDGYSMTYRENDGHRQAEIRFGTGTPDEQPLNWPKIKPLLEASGLRWQPDDGVWAVALGQDDRVSREENCEYVRALLRGVAELEEDVRGPYREVALSPGTPRQLRPSR